jgi:hypothetical protein
MNNVLSINLRTRGFNYGEGWGSAPKPAIYDQAVDLARRLGLQAMEASRAAWRVEHAARAVRLAETDLEKSRAISSLTAIVRFYDLSVASEGTP